MNKRLYIIFLLSFIAFLSGIVSCVQKDPSGEDSGAFDVQFSVPETANLKEGENILTFRILFGKAPVKSDVVVFSNKDNSYDCTISNINEKTFDVTLNEGIGNGTYTVSIRRGSESKKMGEITLSFGVVVEPSNGSTVYGMVTCEGKGVADVVISDGVEVVKTDGKGVYQMKSKKKYGYVFISIPGGYETPAIGVLPTNYSLLVKDASSPERVDFELVNAGDQTNHTILVFGDMHLAGGRNEDRSRFAEFCDEINSYLSANPDEKIYAITLGDMTWDYYWYDKSYQFPAYLNDVNRIKGLTIYHTIGNHDHDMMKPGDFDNVVQYMTEVAPDYYSFNIGNVHYIVLDDILSTSNGGGKTDRKYKELVTDEQLAWIAKDIAFVPKSCPIVVTMHATTSNLDTDANRNALINSFAGYEQVHFFTGHTHQVANKQSGNYYDHNCGAVCADWWDCVYRSDRKVHLGTDGAPAGYEIFKIKGNDFEWIFKGTHLDKDIQFRSYDRNNIHLTADKYLSGKSTAEKDLFNKVAGSWTTASSANEVYMNVWNYGPGWNIEVTENGKQLTVSKADGATFRDPLHIIAYMPASGKTAEDSFTTKSCSHMWKVTASSADSTLEIKVTDNFGNVYTETMSRPKAFNVDTYRYYNL